MSYGVMALEFIAEIYLLDGILWIDGVVSSNFILFTLKNGEVARNHCFLLKIYLFLLGGCKADS
jgi:hypothetical protein